uniref:Transmembrane protein 100 n=1 Tax=Stegastes partitus TaxID=144197 RepID=A0A3B5BJ82_9TELE
SLHLSSCRHMLAASIENNSSSSNNVSSINSSFRETPCRVISGGSNHRTHAERTVGANGQLAQATGGTEKSWYRCVFPFGVISLVIGMAGTGVTFTFDTLLQTKVVSVALLCVGVMMLLVAAVCWRAHRLRKRKKKEGGFFTADQGTL